MSKSDLEEALAFQIRAVGLPEPVREYQFAKSIGRRWRFDFSWPDRKLALEVEGGVWVQGRHSRGSGFIADCEKYAEAAILGWTVLRIAGPMINNGQAIDYLERMFDKRPLVNYNGNA